MKRLMTVIALSWGTTAFAAAVPVGTTFSYQGRLDDGGVPADGEYDMRFSLYDAPAGGNRVGPILIFDGLRGNPAPIDVDTGLFSTGLNFGDGIFAGDARWLQIEVRPHGNGSYVTLTPRQPITAVPYALHALSAPGGGSGMWNVSGANIYNNNSGNVGIGTSNPLTTLDVFGEDAVLRVESIRNDFGPKLVFRNRTAGNGIYRGTIQFQDADNTLSEIGYRKPLFGPAVLALVTMGGGLLVADSGNVGVGVSPSEYKLDVANRVRIRQGGSPSAGIWFHQDEPDEDRGFVGMRSDDAIGFYGRYGAGWGLLMNTLTGDVGIGDETPAARLGVYKDETDNRAAINATNTGTGVAGYFATTNNANTSPTLVAATSTSAPAFATLGNAVINGEMTVNGTAQVQILEIVGADLAEKFPASDKPEPGMVVEIDPENAGNLRIARGGAYNRRVAGVVSGANDLSVGAVLGHLPGLEDAPPIALSGRVWVHCDAGENAIELGDLLTTSTTPGHAMKVVDHARATGATIGKAMTPLAKGQTGMVLVLVNLQ